jgi:crossover junction endodeoxyribonuclease RusA
VHWARRAKHTKEARKTAWHRTLAVASPYDLGLDALRKVFTVPKNSRVSVQMAFCPPDKRRRDGHNLASSMKGAIDGIADALGIDDSRFVVSHELLDDIVKGGEVRVTIKAIK